MLFDERPKEKREELYNREKELEEIRRNLHRPLILVTGIRRIGKTSVLKVALNSSGIPFIILDCRKLKQNYSKADLYRIFSEALSSKLDFLKEIVSRIRGISILGNYVEIKWKGEGSISIADIFDKLNEKRLIIAIDEAQRLRGPLSTDIKNAIAYSYDYNKNLTFILTGSEVGLLYDFLGKEDPDSPLFGRYYQEIKLERFDEGHSKDFLRKGFSELGIEVAEDKIDSIVNFFDGIPGWLTFAGNLIASGKDIETLKESAISLALEELNNLLELKSQFSIISARRYKIALKCISEGRNSWSELLRCIEDHEGKTISSSVFFNLLKNLEELNIIKEYKFLDPIYREASKRLH